LAAVTPVLVSDTCDRPSMTDTSTRRDRVSEKKLKLADVTSTATPFTNTCPTRCPKYLSRQRPAARGVTTRAWETAVTNTMMNDGERERERDITGREGDGRHAGK
jgi:hypothetical protein